MQWSFTWLSRKRAFFFLLKCLFLWDWASVYFWCLAPFPCHRRSPRENFQAGRLSPCSPTPPGQSPNRYKRSASLSEAAPFWLEPAVHHHHRTHACQGPMWTCPAVSLPTHTQRQDKGTHAIRPKGLSAPDRGRQARGAGTTAAIGFNDIVWNLQSNKKIHQAIARLLSRRFSPQGGSVLLGGICWRLLEWSRQALRNETSSSLFLSSSSPVIASGC